MSGREQNAIGGYFGLELPPPGACFPGAIRFQSARAAFAALLSTIAPKRVWVPGYICDAMLSPLAAVGAHAVTYSIGPDWLPAPDMRLAPGDLLLYVNYFGLGDDAERAVLERFGPTQVVLDRSQAVFAPPRECVGAIYSPRKFFGLPDGGLLVTKAPVNAPSRADAGSVARTAHLLMRHNGQVREGYDHFQRAERSLEDVEPAAMSPLTGRILDSIDLAAAGSRRVANFARLHQALGGLNELAVDPVATRGPLCYPLLFAREGLRQALIDQHVFVPKYWPEAMARVAPGGFEAQLVSRCVPLPCDQRYGEADIDRIIDSVRMAADA